MLRVVLDTNILLSACWKPTGNEGRAVELALAGAFTPCVTNAVVNEYRDVLLRDKFAALRPRVETMLQSLELCAYLVTATSRVYASNDDDDNRVLECAAAAGAKYLVTGNGKHYPSEWGVTQVVNARKFLDAISGSAD